MQVTSFLLGMLSILFVLGVIAAIFGARKIFKLQREVNMILSDLNELHRRISQVSELDNRRIDGEITRVDHLFDHVYRELDSRFERLENTLKNNKQLLKS